MGSLFLDVWGGQLEPHAVYFLSAPLLSSFVLSDAVLLSGIIYSLLPLLFLLQHMAYHRGHSVILCHCPVKSCDALLSSLRTCMCIHRVCSAVTQHAFAFPCWAGHSTVYTSWLVTFLQIFFQLLCWMINRDIEIFCEFILFILTAL